MKTAAALVRAILVIVFALIGAIPISVVTVAAATQVTPWKLFQRLYAFTSRNSPQCIGILLQQQQQQPSTSINNPYFPFNTQPTTPTTTIISNPIANAGPNQSVSRGSLVTLDGTGSVGSVISSGTAETTTGTITAYSWQQTAGPSVILQAPNTARPVFTAPSANPT